MGHIIGESRYQTKITCLDEYVRPDSMARLIDRFVDGLDLSGMGFERTVPSSLGRNSYAPSYMTKLFVYGYESGTRSSRRLEDLTHINIEVMWLMDELKPDFKTIADFRKDNLAPLTSLLEEYNSFADYCGMFGKERIAVDGTKIKASNNKKNNYSRKKLDRNLEYNERRIKEYISALEESDDMDEASVLTEKIAGHEKRIERSMEYINRLDESGENETSTVDPDARLMVGNRGSVDCAYNVQAAVDGKAHLVAAFDVTNRPADQGQLSKMTEKTQEALRKKNITVLADKGYYKGEDIEKTEELGAVPIVARQLKPGEKNGHRFSLDKFVYDNQKDEYTCPAGEILHAHSKSKAKDRKFFNKTACKDCPFICECAGKNKFRFIVRKKGNNVLDRADIRYKEHKEEYNLRQQIVEHPFGTIKRTMNGGYYLLRTMEKVRAETALLMLGYNLKRTKGYLGFERMIEMMDEWQAFIQQYGRYCFYNVIKKVRSYYGVDYALRPT